MRSCFHTALTASCLVSAVCSAIVPARLEKRATTIAPKVVIISMFPSESEVWYGIPEFNLNAMNVTVPGLSPLYPAVHCTANGDVCNLIIGEAEINAAASITALAYSPKFDFTTTYFMVAGIAGVNPEVATICSVTFARYAVQVALEYEFDPRDIPSNFSTGYIPLGSYSPSQYPKSIYGTEVFEFNRNLQRMAAQMASNASLSDSAAAKAYRAMYNSTVYAAGASGPTVVECDVATSDVYYSGTLLSEAFGNYTTLVTNGTGNYCTTAQEDNATGEALLRAANNKLVDFSRIIVMRTASDFDRPWTGEAATTNLWWADQGAFEPAVQNIYNAGIKVVTGILSNWNSTFSAGVNASNYVGDIFGTLGGTPDFGPYTSNNSELSYGCDVARERVLTANFLADPVERSVRGRHTRRHAMRLR